MHRASVDDTVGPGEVDVFEDATLGRGLGEARAADAVGVDGEQFARLDLTDVGRADDVEGCGLGRHHPSAVETTEAQWPDTVRIARRVQRVLVHEGQAERTPKGREQLHRGLLDGRVRRAVGQQRPDDVRVRGGAAGAP